MIHSILQSKGGYILRRIIERNNLRIENIHEGESCYIFGDGHSIKYYDLSNFNDKVGIACNHFPFHKDFNKTNTKYAILIEPYYFMPFFDKIILKRKVKSILSLNPISFYYRKMIKKNPKIKFFVSLSNYFFLKSKNLHFLYRDIITKKGSKNNEICKKFNCDKGVLRRAISLAIYLGFKKIYLVGCDYLFYPRQSGHWYEAGKPIIDFKFDRHYIDDFINEATRQGIDFKLVTPFKVDSNVEIITYNELFEKNANYQENTNLLEKGTIEFFSMQNDMKL